MSAAEREHSARLVAHIRQCIEHAGGWLDFERYMDLALYAPGLGYYSAGAHKLGAGGDFTTAPETSPLFSRCVANQCAQVLRTVGGDLLELGAGSGVMAADMLMQLAELDALPARYFILDVSADLRARQQVLLAQRVPQLLSRIHWLDALPDAFTGVIVGNEVVDALPVHRFCIEQDEICTLGVSIAGETLQEASRPASAELIDAVRAIEQERGEPFATGYRSEINLRLHAWMQLLGRCLQRGALLLIDYGLPRLEYYSDSRAQGTLACFYRHHIHDDALVHVGVQDITAWVNFTALAESGIAAGLDLAGYNTQAHFLLGTGLDRLLSRDDLDDKARWQQSQQAQQLIMPSGMGETFKAMAFSRNFDEPLMGFAFRDLRDRL